MPLTRGWDERNLVPNRLGLNGSHSSQEVWARNKKKRKENREEGDSMSKELARKQRDVSSCFV